MTTTVLEIVQSVCYRINLPAPSSITSSTDPGTLQLLHILYAVAEDLRQSCSFPQQKRIYSFETTSGRSKYPLPEDFYAAVLDTHWNSDENRRLVGPLSDSEMTYRLYGVSGSSTNNFGYRIFGPDGNPYTGGGQFQVEPTPTSAITLTFEYYTKSLFLPPNWTPGGTVTANDYRNANGNIYKYSVGGTTHASVPPSHTSGSASDGTATAVYQTAAYVTIVTNNDLPLFDVDLMKLGLRAKWIEEKGEEFNPAMQEYNGKISAAKARWHGSFIGTLGRTRKDRRYKAPEGSWSL